MPETFSTVWRRVRLSVPAAPVFLVQSWVNNTYRNLAQRRPWNWLLQDGQLVFQASRDLACTVTLGSTTVTSAALFVPGDLGRQFRVGNYPIYTVAGYTDTSTITLDRAYATYSTTGAVTGTILDAYGVLPASFGSFAVVIDPINQRLVPWWATQDEMSVVDPMRMANDATPRLLVAAGLSPVAATLNRPQFEYWPKPAAAGALQYWMIKRPELGPDEPLTGVLAARPDVLETGALAKAARWPGTTDLKNPYFNIQLARELETEYERQALQLDLRDDDQNQLSWSTIPWQKWSTWAWAYDTSLLRETDATLAAYFGYTGLGGGY